MLGGVHTSSSRGYIIPLMHPPALNWLPRLLGSNVDSCLPSDSRNTRPNFLRDSSTATPAPVVLWGCGGRGGAGRRRRHGRVPARGKGSLVEGGERRAPGKAFEHRGIASGQGQVRVVCGGGTSLYARTRPGAHRGHHIRVQEWLLVQGLRGWDWVLGFGKMARACQRTRPESHAADQCCRRSCPCLVRGIWCGASVRTRALVGPAPARRAPAPRGAAHSPTAAGTRRRGSWPWWARRAPGWRCRGSLRQVGG